MRWSGVPIGVWSWTPSKDEGPPGVQVVGPSDAKGCSDGRPASAAAPRSTSKTLPLAFAAPARPQNAVSVAHLTLATL
jgi:hypothetical protein